MNNGELQIYSADFLDRIDGLKQTIREKHMRISNEPTPAIMVERRPDGFDYIKERYLREGLNQEFPMWSWTGSGEIAVVPPTGAEWVMVSGTLEINDEGIPRSFWGPGAARVKFKKGQPHTPENLIDLDKDIASANSNAFKRCVNRLCNIGDDVYKKTMTQPLKDETKLAFLDTLSRLTPEGQTRYETFTASAGGLDRCSETKVQEWIVAMERRLENQP